MKKISILLCILFILQLTIPLYSCNVDGEKEGDYITFTDSTGERVCLDARPTRVAVLFSSFAEAWTLAGGDIYVTVGESVERGFAEDSVLLVDSGAGKTVNTELLISYEPDLVILSADIPAHLECAKALKTADIPCALMRIESLDDYLYALKIFTDITDRPDLYEKNGTYVKNRVISILESVKACDGKPKILFIRAGSTYRSVKAKNSDNNFVCKMLEDLNAYNIADNAPLLLDGISEEEIIREDPDFIFISLMGDEEASYANVKSILSSDAYKSLDAVKNGRCHYLPKNMFQYKPNEKWADAYLYLAEILYESK